MIRNPKSLVSPWRALTIGAAFLCGALAGPAPLAADPKPPAPPALGPLNLDDELQPLIPKHARTEADRDRIEAAAQFATGRMHERRQEYAEALRCYQRALRCDPQSAAIVQAILPLTVHLKRDAEAVRYALKAAELEDADPRLLQYLGDYLTQEGEWSRAITLYEKALAVRGKNKETADDIERRLGLGRLYQATEKYKQAADCFARVIYALDRPDEFGIDEQRKKAILGELPVKGEVDAEGNEKMSPPVKPGSAYRLMGDCFLSADRPQDALSAFQKADRLSPDKARLQFDQARVLAKTGKPSEAVTALEAGFAAHLADEGIAPYELLASVLDSMGKKDELLTRLEKLHAAEPGNVPLGYFLAGQYRAAGKSDKAEALYLELFKTKPLLVYRNLAEMYQKSKRFDALLNVLGEALETGGVMDVLGAEEQAVSGDADAVCGVVAAARARIKADPQKFGYGSRLAVALLTLEAKEYETAGAFFNLALADKPKQASEVLMVWGVGLLGGERAAEAAKVFQRAIDEKAMPDDDSPFYFYLAGALAVAGQTDEALAAARQAGEKNHSARFRGRAAWVLYFAKRNDEARTAYGDLVREFDSDYTSAETRNVLREARLALSNLCVIQGDMSQAEEWLEQVLDEFPDDVGAMNDLGYLWADQNKNLARAKRMIQTAVDAEPDNMAYRDSLGWVLFRMEKYPEAAVELEKAVAAGKKPDGVVLDHLGDAYKKLNQRDKAVEAWRKAAEALRQEKEMEKAQAVEKKMIAN